MRYANGVTFWTARSILSATLVKAVIAGSARNYRTHERTAMSAPWRRHASCRGIAASLFLTASGQAVSTPRPRRLHWQNFMLAFLHLTKTGSQSHGPA